MLDARPTTTHRDVQAHRERGARQLAAVLDGLAGASDTPDPLVGILRALRSVADLGAHAFVSEFTRGEAERLTFCLEGFRPIIEAAAERHGRVANVDDGLRAAASLCDLFGRTWSDIFATRSENDILDDIACTIMLANDLENCVFANRIVDRAAMRALGQTDPLLVWLQ